MPKVKTKSRKSERAIVKKNLAEPVEKSPAAADTLPVSLPSKDQKRKERHKAWLDSIIGRKILDTIKPSSAKDAEPTKKTPRTVVSSAKLRSNKSKKRAEMQEIVRMQKVMNLSAFKENPLAAIRQHVQNTFGADA
ncbi:hypothetical protein BX666DRAFT_1337516 [Dichotomocladium elegans]|nr:hypothetical protein BX666DRAFT_1337516 [Dichotomocladium elegans]